MERQLAIGIAGFALVIGALAGGLNATLITGLRLPPLIVTLGTYSLFRGIAEAITRGADTFTDFPASFLFLGQDRWLGLPTQAWIFCACAVGVWLLVHSTTFGRSFRAIGFSPEGARYAGLPVSRRVAFVYVLAGVPEIMRVDPREVVRKRAMCRRAWVGGRSRR